MKNKKDVPTTFSASIDYSTGIKVSDLITRYNVRVMYKGKNRNQSYFSEDVINRMVETIGGIPVVGAYSEERGDFLSHGELQYSLINGEVVTKRIGTQAYGFVPPGAKTWYENHLDTDGVTRTYLATEVYLWTGRYPELEILAAGENNQSMELNPASIDGERVSMLGDDLFVFSQAEFDGLCILGKGVDPCFEGAGFTPVANFSMTHEFSSILNSMKKEFEEVNFNLSNKEETTLKNEEKVLNEEVEVVEETIVEENSIEVTEEVVEEFEVSEDIEEVLEPEVTEEENFEEIPLTEPTDEELEAIESEPVSTDDVLDISEEELSDLEQLHQDLDGYEALKLEVEELRAKVASYEAKELREKKEALYNSMVNEIKEEDKETIFSLLDELSIEEIEVKMTTSAYQNMKLIIENKALERTISQEDKPEDFSLNAMTYQFSEPVSNEESIPGWIKEVLKRQG